MLPLAIDALIILLLVVACTRAARLYRTLKELQTNGNEFEDIVAALDHAAVRAEGALAGLRQIADESGQKLGEKSAAIQKLLDDLEFMTKRGDQMADRLEGILAQARTLEPHGSRSEPAAAPSMRGAPSDLEQVLRSLR